MFDSITHPQKRAFLAAYATRGRVTDAAEACGISRESHYDWKRQDAEYAQAFDIAGRMAGDALEEEAIKRAVDGWLEPVWHQGMKCGARRKRSDRLLALLLQGAKPEKYAARKVEHSGEISHRHEVDLSGLADEELETLERILGKARVEGDAGSDTSGAPEAQAQPDREPVPGDGPVSA